MTPGLNITHQMVPITVKNINLVYWKRPVDHDNNDDNDDNERVNQ